MAMSLPLGLMAILLLIAVPAFLSDEAPLGAVESSFMLLAVWALGLMGQCLIAQFWFGQRRRRNETSRFKPRGAPSTNVVTLTIGGIWAAPPSEEPTLDDVTPADREQAVPRIDTGASRLVMMWASVLAALGVAAWVCLIVDGQSESGVDRPWVAAAWMFGLQAIWQVLPMPQSLGRVGWSVVLGWLSPTLSAEQSSDTRSLEPWESFDAAERRDATIGPDALMSTRRVRWWVLGFAFSTLIVGILAIRLAGFTTESGGQPLPVFAGVVLMSMWLFASSRNEDLFAIALTLSENGEIGRLANALHPIAAWRTIRDMKSQRDRTTRLKAAVAAERAEASDAARVDEILQRLHEQGPDSLSRDERDLLQRVSEAIRRQRSGR
nr:hypothetical protein [Neorhodopirellula pilleata]